MENLVRLEAKPANMEGNRAITIRDLIRTALRMAPNRIIVGEIRGEEAVDLLQAWNTGHDGSLGTAHANSTGDMISRVETMVLMGMELPLEAVRRQIASGVELLVHLERARDGKRQVAEIAEILGYEDGEVRMHGLYRREKDQLKRLGNYSTGKNWNAVSVRQNYKIYVLSGEGMDLVYPAEYRDYRDYQFFCYRSWWAWGLGIPIGIWYTRWRKRSWQSGDGGFYGIILKRCCRGCRRRCGQDIRWNRG